MDFCAAMASKAQDLLAQVKLITIGNSIAFGGGNEDQTHYGIQLEPLYSIENIRNFNQSPAELRYHSLNVDRLY